MTVQTATRMWSRTGGSISTTDGRDRSATVREGYQVVCDPADDVSEILDAPGLPRLEQTYSGTAAIFCKRKSPTQVSPILWTVDVDWEGEFGPSGSESHPINNPAEIEWSDVETDEPIDEDFDGSPIVTVNGEPISGVTIKIADQVLTIEKNFLAINTAAIASYRRATNSDTFYGWAPGTARMIGFTAKRAFVRSTPPIDEYWNVSARFQFREPYQTTADKAWYARVRHEGYFVKVGAKIVHATDDRKEKVSKPVLLKSDGTRETVNANAHWLEIKRYDSLPFNSLGLS